MSRSIFGWSYPPGVSSVPGDEPDPMCPYCGNEAGNCECPECPVCQAQADPECYEKGHMKLEDWQIDRVIEIQERMYWEIEAENLYWRDFEKLHANEEQLWDEEDADGN